MVILSIVIPLYNSQQFINKTLDRLCKGNLFLNEIEIVLVDDGSTDLTNTICREYIKNNPLANIKLITKKNEGIASARNRGLKESIGKYVFFHDHDDFFEINGFQSILDLLKKQYADIIMFNVDVIKNDKRYPFISNYLTGLIKDNDVLFLSMFGKRQKEIITTRFGNIWANVFLREFILSNNIIFKTFMHYEDDFNFILECMIHEPTIFCTQITIYTWIIRDNSTSNSQKEDENYFKKLDSYIAYLRSIIPSHFYQKEELIENISWFYTYEYVSLYLLNNSKIDVSDFVKQCKLLSIRKRMITKNSYKKTFKASILILLFKMNALKFIKLIKR